MNRSSFVVAPWFRSLSLASLLLVTALGCGKDSDSPAAQTTSLEGNWKVSSLAAAGVGDLLPVATQVYGSCITDVTLSFKTGGSVSYDNPASCAASAASIATLSAATGIDANSKWSQSGNVLTITPGTGAPRSFTTASASASAVQLQGPASIDLLTPGTKTTYNLTVGLRKI